MSNKNLTKNDILQAIKSLAIQKETEWLSYKEFVKETGIPLSQVLKYFDCWNDAVKEAGLKPLNKLGKPDVQKGYSEEQLLEMMRVISSKLGKQSLSLTEFCNNANISENPIYRIFGNWNTALQKAGLIRHPRHRIKIPENELFSEYYRVKDELKRFPSYNEFARRSKYSIGVYENRFGNFTEFRKHAIQYQYFAKKSFKISHLKHSTAILIFNFLLTHPSISSKKTSNLNRSSSIIGGPL